MFFNQFPSFILDNITLRELKEEDVSRYYQYMSSPQVAHFLTSENIPKNYDDARNDVIYWRNLFYSRKSIFWAIALTETDEIIGTVGFNNLNLNHKKAELSYDLNYNYWGQKIMRKSIQHVIGCIQNFTDIKRIQATVWTENHRSNELLVKLDFTTEGIMRNFEIINGKSRDYYMFAKIF